MSYWSNNPELLDEITTRSLPNEWREKVESGEIDLYDVPEDIVYHATLEGERDYWASLADGRDSRFLNVQKKEEGYEP